MPLLFAIILIAAAIILVNFLAAINNSRWNQLFDRALLLLNLPFLLVGVIFVLLPPESAQMLRQQEGLPLDNFFAAGLTFIGVGAWAVGVSLPAARRWLARWLPLNPASPVHTLALALSGYVVGNTLLTLTQGGLEQLAAAAQSATIVDLLFQQGLFALIAVLGAGALVRRQGDDLRARLGLERPSLAQIQLAARWIVILVVLQWAVGLLWAILDPAQSQLLDNIGSELYGNFDTVWEWFLLALSAGIGEELLFRGAMQPALGLGFTAVIFAIAHVQYGITPITLAVFLIGLALGHIRRRSNTTVAILVHFGYNFVLGLMSLLAVYLEQFVP